ncbi:MAG: nicotinate-nucleotide adenylyltransferase [Acidobacteriota bacterium]
MRRAIFGGTFDPIHIAHLRIAKAAADQFALDQVLFIPAANPPHKHTGTDYEHRYKMVELACAETGDARFIPSRLEQGQVKSYSILTVEGVRATMGSDDELFFIIGSDAFAEIETWYRWRELLPMVTFIVVARPGHTCANPEGARVLPLDTVAMPTSSSHIRSDLKQGRASREVSQAVEDYIETNGLYR